MLFIYEPFRLSHQEDDAAGSLCSEFEPDLWRKNVAYNGCGITYLTNIRYFHLKDQAGTCGFN